MMGYAFWQAPTSTTPEFASGGHKVSVIPGMGQWVLLHPSDAPMPQGAVPVKDVVSILKSR